MYRIVTTDAPANPYLAYRSTRFFGSLDGLRAFAIVAVIWFHTGPQIEVVRFLNQGQLGVQLFFALSGFLITTLLLRERDRHGSIAIGKFYMRRSLRIFPLYYTVLLVYAVAVLMLERGTAAGEMFWTNLPAFLTYTSNWFVSDERGGRVIFYFAWSLAAEEQFYLVWPSVERWLRGWWPVAAAGGIVALVLGLVFGIETGHVDDGALWVTIVLSIQLPIVLGVIAAHLLHREATFRWVYRVLGSVPAAPAVLSILLLTIEFLPHPVLIRVLLVMLVISCVCRESNGLARILRLRVLAQIGIVSYGMYLVHMLVYFAVKYTLALMGISSKLIVFGMVLVVTTIAAMVSFRYFEAFFLRLKDRFTRIETRHPADEGEMIAETEQPQSEPR